MSLPRLAATAALLTFVALGQQPTAASVTEPGRTLLRPLDVVLGGPTSEPQVRTVMVVVAASPALAAAGFVDAFAQALRQNAPTLSRTKLGLWVVGQKGPLVAPTLDHAQVAARLPEGLTQPNGEFQNVYADLRAAAASLAGEGEHIVLLVALDDGDVEDDVEKTIALLAKEHVRTEVVTGEATLADSYWAARPFQEKPRGTSLSSADGAVVDLPWGWLFQIGSANETAPAGFAVWGLSRLAAATGGRVYLYASDAQTKHECAPFGRCLFCDGDHVPQQGWDTTKVAMLAPLATSREATFATLGGDPAFRAMTTAWRAAGEAGLLQSSAGIKLSGTSAAPDRQRPTRELDLTEGASFERHAKRALEAAGKAQQIGDELEKSLAKVDAANTQPRALAAAHYTRVLLQLTRTNLVQFAAWCREIAPAQFDGDQALLPPEVPIVDGEQRPVGIGVSSFCLCHGVRPFLDVELPGGDAMRAELTKLEALFTAFEAEYGQTQFGTALRQNGIAEFWLSFPGTPPKLPRKRQKSAPETPTTITPRRPPRAGGSSTGGTSGPTTGGPR